MTFADRPEPLTAGGIDSELDASALFARKVSRTFPQFGWRFGCVYGRILFWKKYPVNGVPRGQAK